MILLPDPRSIDLDKISPEEAQDIDDVYMAFILDGQITTHDQGRYGKEAPRS